MGPEQANPLMQFIPVFAIIFIFYFLVYKPEKNKQKEHKDKIAGIKKNDQIVTSSGIHGTVVNVKEATLIIRVDDNAKLEIDKDAVATVKA